MAPKKQVSPAIRILRGERDASARATHLEAATRKFLVTTNERKQMSTKTNFKRIALVAIASLGVGLLSSVPAQAQIVGTPTVTVVNGTATTALSDTTTAATIAIRYYAESAGETAVVRFSMGVIPATATAGSESIMVTALDSTTSGTGVSTLGYKRTSPQETATFTNSATLGYGTDSISANVNSAAQDAMITPTANTFAYGKFGVFLDSRLTRVAGTYTINYNVKFYGNNYTTGPDTTKTVAGTFDIVVSTAGNAATGSTSAAGTTTAVMTQGTAYQAGQTIDSTVSVPSTPDGTVRAVIRVTQLTSAGAPARESITVSTTIGNVGSSQAASGKSMTIVGNANGINDINVYSDGNGGTATITIKTTSVTFANKQVTFYGTTVSTIDVTQLATTIGNASTTVLVAVPKDSAGTVVRSNDAVYVYSDASTVISTGTAPAGTSCGNYDSTYGGYLCGVTGSNNGTANLTVRDKSTSTLSTVASKAVSVKVNTAPAAKVTLSFDKATYAPGEAAYIIIKPLDAAGAAIGGREITNLFASGGITANVSFGNGSTETTTLDDVTVTVAATQKAIAGIDSAEAIKVYKVYMPASGGTVKITAKGGSALPSAGQVEVTASASVTDNGAAALAAVNALATTVASLKTLITTLTNLVLKIQKKVKA